MNELVKGVGIEVREMSLVGVIMAVMVPAYLWISKAPNSKQMIGRSTFVATALFAGAIAEGMRRRK